MNDIIKGRKILVTGGQKIHSLYCQDIIVKCYVF